MIYKTKVTLHVSKLLLILGIFLVTLPVTAQSFGNRRITPENASRLTLMATYTHTVPPVIAWSPDGRFLAIGRSGPVGGGPGAGGGPPPYRRDMEQYAADTVLVYDTRNLTDDPIVLRGNGQWVNKMVFTGNHLLILASTTDETYPELLEWQYEGRNFTEQKVLTLILQDSFAIDPETYVIGYFISEGTYMYEQVGTDARRGVGSKGTYPLGMSQVDAANGYFAYQGRNVITVRTNKEDPQTYIAFDTVTEQAPIQMMPSGLYFVEQDRFFYWSNNGGVLNAIPPQVILETPAIDFAVHPDETIIATITLTDLSVSSLLLWDIRQGNSQIPYLTRWSRNNIDDVVFSPDGTRLATVSDFTVELWSLPENLPTPAQARSLSSYNVVAYCGDTVEEIKTGVNVGLVWSWYATDETGIREHVESAHYSISIDQQPLHHWTFATRIIADPVNNNDPTIYFYAPIGDALAIGIHQISYQLEWDRAISDGYATYGPNTDNVADVGGCTVEITN